MPSDELGGQAVAELRVDVVGADHALGEHRPDVRVLVRAARAAEHRDRCRRRAGSWPSRSRRPRGRARRATTPRASAPPSRTCGSSSAVVGVHPLEAVATLVAQPAVVHRLGVDAEQAHEAVRRRLHRAAALHRARRARRLDRREVPGPGAEAVLARGQRADRADLHGVAREVRVERLLFEVQDLHAIAAVDEVDERVARDLVGEADAARALDAALAVEQHEVAQRDRLREVALLLDEPRLAGTERERLVLQRALAAAVADRAVERVVDRAGTRARRLGSASPCRSGCARPCRRRRAWCTRAGSRGRLRSRRGTCGTCRPASCARASRSAGCRCRAPARP